MTPLMRPFFLILAVIIPAFAHAQNGRQFTHYSDSPTGQRLALLPKNKPDRNTSVRRNPSHTHRSAYIPVKGQRNKETKGFFGFNFALNKYPLQFVNRYPAVKFDYAFKGENQIYQYSDSAYISPGLSEVGWNFAIEFGRTKGLYMGLGAGGFFNRYVANTLSAELGYNFPVGKRFFLQPAISYTSVEFYTAFTQIKSNGKDIVAFGKEYPYHSCSCGKSEYLRVAVSNNMNFLQYKFSVNYHVTPYVIIKFGYSYWNFKNMYSDLVLTNKAKQEYVHDAVYTSKALAVKDNRNYSLAPVALWQGSVLLRLKPAPPGSRRTGGYHSSGGHGFSGGHGCH
jgi:hypothetical protein